MSNESSCGTTRLVDFETMEKPYECMIDEDGSVKETRVSI